MLHHLCDRNGAVLTGRGYESETLASFQCRAFPVVCAGESLTVEIDTSDECEREEFWRLWGAAGGVYPSPRFTAFPWS
jgi:hypothetical protein